MIKRLLEKKLKEINRTIKRNYLDEKDIGLLGGISGVALFQFYYSRYFNQDASSEVLKECFERINNGYNNLTYCNGIAGFGWLLDHLDQENFIEHLNDDLLKEFDEDIYKFMIYSFDIKLYDFLQGAIGSAFYFLNRFKRTKSKKLKNDYKDKLFKFIQLLIEISEKEDINKVKWNCEHFSREKQGYNLSLAHGIPGIIGFLTKLYKIDIFKAKTENLLKKAIKYLISHQNTGTEAFSLFPNWVYENGDATGNSRLAWCYGDLGIGITLWNASKELNDKSLKDTALIILKHASKRKIPQVTWVNDIFICHGAYGNAQIFNRIYKETRDSVFKDAAEFWIQIGLSLSGYEYVNEDYMEWRIKDVSSISQVSILNGSAGIGLVILDYLTNLELNWDECLMISN